MTIWLMKRTLLLLIYSLNFELLCPPGHPGIFIRSYFGIGTQQKWKECCSKSGDCDNPESWDVWDGRQKSVTHFQYFAFSFSGVYS